MSPNILNGKSSLSLSLWINNQTKHACLKDENKENNASEFCLDFIAVMVVYGGKLFQESLFLSLSLSLSEC